MFHVVMSVTISPWKQCSVRLYLQLFVGGLIYLICVCLCIIVSNTYCFCFVFLCLMYPMMLVSLDCPFLIAPSVFANVYSANGS
jgi:hypothetical protein